MAFQKCALITFTYPGVEVYLERCLQSFNVQSNKNFTAIIFNDGLPQQRVEAICSKKLYAVKYKIVNLECGFSPAQVREWAFGYLKKAAYNHAIFIDADDYMAEDRVEVVLGYLKKTDIVVNDLHIVDQSGQMKKENYLSCRIEAGHGIQPTELISLNYIGFSNSAINLNKIVKPISIPETVIAVDWYLFYMLLHQGFSAIFTNETSTYYRQHANNLIGVQESIPEKIMTGLQVKAKHYQAIGKNIKEYLEWSDYYQDLLSNKDKLSKKIAEMTSRQTKTVHEPNLLWWEGI